jgi:hypothetical protein
MAGIGASMPRASLKIASSSDLPPFANMQTDR